MFLKSFIEPAKGAETQGPYLRLWLDEALVQSASPPLMSHKSPAQALSLLPRYKHLLVLSVPPGVSVFAGVCQLLPLSLTLSLSPLLSVLLLILKVCEICWWRQGGDCETLMLRCVNVPRCLSRCRCRSLVCPRLSSPRHKGCSLLLLLYQTQKLVRPTRWHPGVSCVCVRVGLQYRITLIIPEQIDSCWTLSGQFGLELRLGIRMTSW